MCATSAPTPAHAHGRKLIFLFADDPAAAERQTRLLESFGYGVRVSKDPGSVSGGLMMFKPDALVIDNVLEHNVERTLDALERLTRDGRLRCPTVFVGDRENMNLRLRAVRGGCSAFLDQPLNPMQLVDILDRLTAPIGEDPLRVLIIDDSRTSARHHAAILEKAGMTTMIVTAPMTVAQPLKTFQPELILMDLHMPGCSGEELAGVIRQEEAFHAIPIVFLSSEADTAKQLAAMRKGGDDFLVKPIDPDHLTDSVLIRAARFRELRTLILRDSLTGLFNHTTTKTRLADAIVKARQDGLPLTMAITDIDLFKRVNDTYGHSVGDTVIKTMARLLKQRLRRSDIIGRMGGEEFAAVLPGLSAEKARSVFDAIREEFAAIEHDTDLGPFRSTFSCGLADLSRAADASALNDAADRALYEAKESGRNRVVVAAASPILEA